MGIRLVRYNRPISGNTDSNTGTSFDHSELINRDLINQHPIYAITGLQEVLNILEDNIYEISKLLTEKDTAINDIVNNIDSLQKELEDLKNDIENIMQQEFKDSNSISFSKDETNNSVTAKVKLYKPTDEEENNNAIQDLDSGLFVPKFRSKDSNTISWKEEILGESLAQIFENGSVFSHNGGTNNLYYPNEANAWYWDENLKSFVQPQNTSSFTGFVTKDLYDNYVHSVQIRSTNSDDDANGVVIGYLIENDIPYTLSAIVDRGGLGGNKLNIIYNYRLSGQVSISSKSISGGSGAWSSVPNGLTVEIKKYGNILSVACSSWNQTAIDENTRIDINLNDFEYTKRFCNKVKYGYCNRSQAYSFFQNVSFVSTNTATSSEVIASVIISKQQGNSIVEKDDGLYCEQINISKQQGNALKKHDDGYYVEEFKVSEQQDNILQKLSDGYYVKQYYNRKLVLQELHNFNVGDFIFYHPLNKYQKASAIDNYDSNIVGMVVNVIDENTFEYQWSGMFETNMFSTSNGYVQGMPLYVSDIKAGSVTQEQPDISKTVGYPVENIGLIIAIERGIQYNQESKIGDFKTSANTYNIRSDGFIRVIENVNYKQSLISSLLDTLTDDFKSKYIIIDNTYNTIQFINTEELFEINKVPEGLNLFIKAF